VRADGRLKYTIKCGFFLMPGININVSETSNIIMARHHGKDIYLDQVSNYIWDINHPGILFGKI
jgi:hypothetical protein